MGNKSQRAMAAEHAGIVGCLKLCGRPGAANATVLGLATSAIVGAAWEDSRSLEVIVGMAKRIWYRYAPSKHILRSSRADGVQCAFSEDIDVGSCCNSYAENVVGIFNYCCRFSASRRPNLNVKESERMQDACRHRGGSGLPIRSASYAWIGSSTAVTRGAPACNW